MRITDNKVFEEGKNNVDYHFLIEAVVALLPFWVTLQITALYPKTYIWGISHVSQPMLSADDKLNLQNNGYGWTYDHEKMDEKDMKAGQ